MAEQPDAWSEYFDSQFLLCLSFFAAQSVLLQWCRILPVLRGQRSSHLRRCSRVASNRQCATAALRNFCIDTIFKFISLSSFSCLRSLLRLRSSFARLLRLNVVRLLNTRSNRGGVHLLHPNRNGKQPHVRDKQNGHRMAKAFPFVPRVCCLFARLSARPFTSPQTNNFRC